MTDDDVISILDLVGAQKLHYTDIARTMYKVPIVFMQSCRFFGVLKPMGIAILIELAPLFATIKRNLDDLVFYLRRGLKKYYRIL